MQAVAALAMAALSACLPPEWGAGAILHPMRRPLIGREPELAHERIAFRTDDGLLLQGWLFRTPGLRRGLIVYLHGIADNRRSGIGLARRLVPKGWDVLAYDARAHGESEGHDCTYGFREKHDVSRALDAVGADGAVLFGSSLGAAVALQAAAVEPRVRGVIAQSSFSDLESIVRERAPWIASPQEVGEALRLAEARARFQVADVSPREAAGLIQVPVLLIHGAEDRETSPAHSRRIYEALRAPRQLLIVPGAGHNDVLAREDVWTVVERWLAEASLLQRKDGRAGGPHTGTQGGRTWISDPRRAWRTSRPSTRRRSGCSSGTASTSAAAASARWARSATSRP